MYGYVFHNDAEKLSTLDEMPQSFVDASKIQSIIYVMASSAEIARVKRIKRALRLGLV